MMLKQSLKCIIFNKLFTCLILYIFLQRIPTISTYNVSEDFDIELEPIEKVNISPYIYPIISLLNLSGINVAPEKKEQDLVSQPIPPMETQNLTEKFDDLMAESSERFKEKDSNLSQEIEKSLTQIEPRSEVLKDKENNGIFLMKLLFNFYIPPILTFYKPLLNEEVKYYKNLINVNKQFSNDTDILSGTLNDVIEDNTNDTNEDGGITRKINGTEFTDSNLSLRTNVTSSSTDFDTENDSVFQIISRWKEIFKLTLKDEPKTSLSRVEATTIRNLDNVLKAEKFFKPDLPTSTQLPKLSFTNNTAVLALFRPGEIPRIDVKKDPNLLVSFKTKFPSTINNSDEINNMYSDHNKTYISNTTLRIPLSDNSSSLVLKIYSPSNISESQASTTTSSNISISLNKSDATQSRILYSAEGSMIPGVLEIITTTTTKLPPLSLKTAPRDRYESRKQPKFSSQYSANSTTQRSIVETSTTGNETKNIFTTNESLTNILINSTSVLDSPQVENTTKSDFFIDNSSVNNSTIVSASKETTLASSDKINNDDDTSKDVKNITKRELSISDQYNVNDRQELASYFYNGKKIHESYLNYANSVDHELPQDLIQYQDKFIDRTDLSSHGNEVIYQNNQENSQILQSGYNLQQKPALSFDSLFPNPNLQSNVEKEVSILEKETSTLASVYNNDKINRKVKKSKKNVLNRKKVNAQRKNNKDDKSKKKIKRLTKKKVSRNSEKAKKKKARTYSSHKNAKARQNIRKRIRNNKITKNKRKMPNRVRSKKKNTHKQNNTKLKDMY